MCGIAGYVNLDGRPADRDLLERMIRTLQHRGPDGYGVKTLGATGLAHARLSIIDLCGGAQPMTTAGAAIWITFNGEIYNYIELRQSLIERGHTFSTQSDTEVILRAYLEYGDQCVDAFNGQFAFAIWDEQRQRLFAARDRTGKKPFYYARTGDVFVFGSELKAIAAHPAVPRRFDLHALQQIMTFWCTVPPRTALQDVSELPPGCRLVLENRCLRVSRYWRLQYQDGDCRRTEADYADELRALLIDAVRLRMLRSDVPVGAYLSGGLDSTTIAATVKRYTDVPLKTFSVTFSDTEFDEGPYQRRVVSELGLAEHCETECSATDIGRVFPDVIRHSEQPIVRTAPAPLLLLSRLVRSQGYKVVLTGEGSDEVLGGYDIFKEAKVRRFWAREPESRLRPLLLRKLYPYLPRLQSQSPAYLRAFFHADPKTLDDPFFSHRPRWEMTSRIGIFLSGDAKAVLNGYEPIEELRGQLPAEFSSWPSLCQAQHLETSLLLPGYILSSQGDRMQMANSVEGRCPFLDYRLAEFAASVPPRMKMKGLNEKNLLKKAVGDLVPPFLATRPKQPYRSTDVPSFFDEQGRTRFEYIDDVLSQRTLASAGIFDPAAVSRLIDKARAGQVIGFKDSMAFVTVLSTQLVWAQLTQETL